ncbi:heterogeneous nuclear ribonucleoprotein 1 [Amborella trichopoda]|uniref:RRM domain-containing protein n=1 Tax=Amborella trichopoda TaxID=13333 RepID=U5DBX0_AMBTC|nr:heterogeneous nuclear ribonucleoprotein 1 [Amborella trichopoda]ERN18932.1 hypothetical protein AMTR_s00067p00185510 [Amborella trichopoda]|eukprot:XP_006857465.1 heterogeneous nuclear ribonucleoprotein 1 [Amborella trichopoda]
MDSDQGKLFIGGISWETSEDKLKDYFGKYGEVSQTVIMRDKITGRPRGFGFVVFTDPSVLDRVLQDKHTIDGRTVEAKRALSREEQHNAARSGNPNSARNFGAGSGAAAGSNVRTKKIFVGGLPPTLTEEGFRQYFEQFGNVTDVVVMYDQNTQRPRGFGFISFDSEDAVDRVLQKSNFHDLNGKYVEVKRALPKDANPGGGGRNMGGAGAYQANPNTYESRMDGNRYVQPPAGGAGYPPYGSSGYGAPSYGYGAANNGTVGYGGYGYGNPNAPSGGYGGPGGGYGNASAPSGGAYPPGAPRSPWNNQAPSGYGMQGGPTGYGAGSWGGGAPGVGPTGAGGGVAGPTGQSPSGHASYANPGYGGYGGYGGGDGAYGGAAGYGAVGGRGGGVSSGTGVSGGSAGGVASGEQGGGGYMGSGYGDSNGNAGFWRSDASSQGGAQGYGVPQANGPPSSQVGYGGYGAQTRQVQQQ